MVGAKVPVFYSQWLCLRRPNRAGASIATDPFASPRNSFGSTHSHGSQSSVGSNVSAYTSYAQGPRPAPSILSEHGDGRYAEQSRGKRRQPGRAHDVTIPSYHDPRKTMQLLFSDEFEIDGRSFYPGDDLYWEAVNLHYWQTGDLEWYDPSAVTTKNGALEITLSKCAFPFFPPLTHFTFITTSCTGGMISSWNKFCFTGGILLSSVTLPGTSNVLGLWPAVWAMGNLGRAGTLPDNSGPQAALDTGGVNKDAELSFFAWAAVKRVYVCALTAGNWFFQGESHPGPTTASGTFVGRSAPEIDVFEATIGGPTGASVGQVSQSAQWAPFDAGYASFNMTDNLVIPDPTISAQNAFVGNQFQQTTSVDREQECYQLKSGCFSTYGFEYTPGDSDVYISWITNDNLAWTLNCNTVGADKATQMGARLLESLTHTHS
ncbi:beta-glucan synthesis-associated protein-domain-containing protein [Mycena haematopus]|nr:beta-glucan synthesis-associated protein-domain-containing protein [Mycena haematopus]